MRISSNLFFQTGLNAINAQQADLLHLYQQIGSGQRMVTPADDPLAAAQAINLSQSQALNKQFDANREVLKNNLGAEENALNGVTLLMQDIKTRLVEAGNGTLSDADRASLATALRGAKENLLGLANSTDGNGQYLFSGHAGSQPAFVADAAGKVSYNGDAGQRLIQADQTRRIAASDTGSDIFASAPPGSRAYLTSAAPGNQGTGLISKPVITDDQGAHAGARYQLTFLSGAPGGPVQYQVDITDPDGTVTSDGPHDYLPGTTRLELPGGLQVALSGAPVAGDVFVAEPAAGATAGLNVFDMLDSVIHALEQPQAGSASVQATLRNMLASALQRTDVHYDQVLTIRAQVGTRLDELDALSASGDVRDLGYRAQLSRLQDVDYYTATSQLQLRSTALEAAAQAFKKIQGISLFNMGMN